MQKLLGAIGLAVGATAAGVALFFMEPDPADISTATGAAFYSRGNYGEALRIFRTLADRGNARAQFNLGIMYANGHGVVQNDEQALKWYHLAAGQKDPDAQNNIGIMYLRGRGVPRDNVRAHMWFSLASAAPTAAEAEAGRINRDIAAADLTPIQMAQARELARRCEQQNFEKCDTLTATRTVSSSPPRPPRSPETPAPAPVQRPQEPAPSSGPSANTPPEVADAPAPFGLPPMPRRIANAELSASEVYRKVSASVFIVFAAESVEELLKDRPRGTSLGSAVAVSATHLVTNCHVVEGRPAIALVQGEEVGRAVLFRQDPNRDQCFLRSLDLELTPVDGVRRFVDLKPGEQVYSIGAPKGQELTIAGGLISGLRVLDEGNHVQTSAPISPGSSGGGLFDDRGNLIGITTFLLRDAQNLNFAIAAEEFWR